MREKSYDYSLEVHALSTGQHAILLVGKQEKLWPPTAFK